MPHKKASIGLVMMVLVVSAALGLIQAAEPPHVNAQICSGPYSSVSSQVYYCNNYVRYTMIATRSQEILPNYNYCVYYSRFTVYSYVYSYVTVPQCT